jgi:3-oxoacyl-[acyl-carrier-protein] synthase-3
MPQIYGQVTGWGAYAPSHALSPTMILNAPWRPSDEWIVQRTGIRQRHVADASDETTSTMAVNASLGRAGQGQSVLLTSLI